MRKNEKDSIKHSDLFQDRLFNGIKNSLKKFSKKSFIKIGLFLVFVIIVFNISIKINFSKNELSNYNFISFETYNKAEAFFSFKGIWEGWKAGMEAQPDAVGMGGIKNEDGETTYPGDSKAGGDNIFVVAIKALLSALNELLARLFRIAGVLMDAILKESIIKGILLCEGIYIGWAIVRDVLNLFFMLILLFSAFATIFQVEKYHLRKMIIMLVVMALLVNFSYPITLFIIDFSNSAMYFLIDSAVVPNTSASANIANFSGLGDALANASDTGSDIAAILFNILLTFMMLITVIAFALNLLIRILAFAILIIVSPAGFAFAFFPGTKNIADDWWSALLKYALMGPVMIFFFYMAVLLFSSNISIGEGIANSVIKFLIPVTFLWMGLIASQKFGITVSAAAMNFAKKTAGNIKSYGRKAAWGGTKMVGRGVDKYAFKGGLGGTWNATKNRWNQFGTDYKDQVDKRTAEIGDKMGVKGANEKLVQENRKKWKEDNGVEDKEATRIDKEGTKAEKMALALERAENKGFDKDPIKAAAQYKEALNSLKDNKVYKELFDGNIRKKNIDLEISSNVSNEMTSLGRSLNASETQAIAQKSFNKIDPQDWREQNIERILEMDKMFGNSGVVNAAEARIKSYTSPQKVTENMRGFKYDAGKGKLWA